MDTQFRFTKKQLEQLPKPESRVRIRDTGVPGLVLDLLPSGTRTFRVYKKIKGQKSPINVTLGKFPGMTIDSARTKALESINKLSVGVNPNIEARVHKNSQVSLKKVFHDYTKSKNLSPHTLRGYNTVINNYFEAYKEKPLSEITEDVVKKLHDELTKSSPAQADLSFRLIRALFNYAKYEYRGKDNTYIFDQNPVQILSHLRLWNKVARKNTRISGPQLGAWFTTIEEERKTGDFFVGSVCDLLETAIFTGLRKSELLNLSWDQVNLSERTYFIGRTKNGDPLELPISDHLLTVFQRRYKVKDHQGFVFNALNEHGVIREPKKVITKISNDSGIQFTLHDLRRTFTTIAESLNVGPYMIKRLLNHRTRRDDVTAGYIVLTPEELRQPAQEIESKILILAGKDLRIDNPEDDIDSLVSSLTEEEKLSLIKKLMGEA